MINVVTNQTFALIEKIFSIFIVALQYAVDASQMTLQPRFDAFRWSLIHFTKIEWIWLQWNVMSSRNWNEKNTSFIYLKTHFIDNNNDNDDDDDDDRTECLWFNRKFFFLISFRFLSKTIEFFFLCVKWPLDYTLIHIYLLHHYDVKS